MAALPASARTVRVHGEAGLAEAVAESGFEVVAGPAPADALLIESRGRSAGSGGAAPTAIAVDAASRAARRPAWRRAFDLASSPLRSAIARRRAGAELARMRSHGPAECLAMSDRSRTVYGLGDGLWKRRLPPVAAIVRSTASPTMLEQAIAESSVAVGVSLEVESLTVRETGKLVAELRGPDGAGYVLRLASGRSAGYVEQAIAALGALTRPEAPPTLRERVPRPLLDGHVRAARFQLEARVRGSHPAELTPAIWGQCMEFLCDLHRYEPMPRGAGEIARDLRADLELLGAVGGPGTAAALDRLAETLPGRLDGVELGWGHGDCWRENLFVRDGDLVSVIDWDAASPRSFPLHDLWDLQTMARRRDPAWGAGMRCTEALWPSLADGEARTAEYCRLTGVSADRSLLGALAIAYWLVRTAREIEEAPQRCGHRGWIRRNLTEPLAAAASL